MRVLKRNAIKCKLCGDVIESKHVHDFQECKCGACFVDGGLEYQRIGGNIDNIEILDEWEDVPGYKVERWSHYGSYHSFMTDEDPKSVADHYENMWDYVRIYDENDNLIYETKGLERYLKTR